MSRLIHLPNYEYLNNKIESYVATKTEWLSPILDVEIGEAMGLLNALKRVGELQLRDMDFEMNCERVVDCIHSSRTYTTQTLVIY
jgi:hypothetical protein